jgi:hypothetical protein
MADTCNEHTGCLARIDGLEKSDGKQWESLEKQGTRIDSIMTRLNVILGGIIVAVLMLLINIVVIKTNGG